MPQISKNYKFYFILTQNSMVFLSSIIIMSINGSIKSKSKNILFYFRENENFFSESYKAISAIFSIEFISTFFYAILFIIYCLDSFYIKIVERIMLLFFLILLFLHLIYCVIIPIYYNDFKCIMNLIEEKNKNNKYFSSGVFEDIKSNYIGAICISYIFLIIMIFIDFILLLDYNKIFDVEILLKFLGEVLCAGFNEKQKIIELKRTADQKTQEIREIFANNLREEIKRKKEENL